jgi:hypothetical protein
MWMGRHAEATQSGATGLNRALRLTGLGQM